MERWVACPASPRLCAGLTGHTSPAAAEGSYAHDMAEKFVAGQLGANAYQALPEEMREAIWMYNETIDADREPQSVLLLERELDGLKEVHPDGGGTADAILWNPKSRILRVYDFKYGKGHYVDVEGNYQLQTYALGAVVTLGYPALE